MNPLTEDLWEIILARLPIKMIKSSKLVCKQWKSIVESPYFRDLFLSLHENSHCSSWSLMFSCSTREIVAHYGCDTWGLPRSLGFYISSFLTNKFKTQNGMLKVWAYTGDVGLILISENYVCAKNRSLYVANPISQECVRTPSHAHLKEYSCPLGMATQTENGILLGYKVVMVDFTAKHFSLLIFSSETGLWSHKMVHKNFTLRYNTTISLPEKIHWLSKSDQEEIVVSMDLYVTGSIQCRLTPFPDSGKHPRFVRYLLTCQGSLMYMNIVSVTKVDGSVEDKLCLWRLKSGEWQLVSQITPTFIETGFEYFPLGINPFDDKKSILLEQQGQKQVVIY
ncbi:PREDICTED: putative F-box protein At3g28280 [Camelina sativa]|uniref:F-box protein At3g28280 n=1 Tax=Camelina sativa TaxID=90675 RepID=A0ABM0TSZ0_CAMSA|nr:PREDICTED: putative F-box protein At3g28280 [Camelina sativa]